MSRVVADPWVVDDHSSIRCRNGMSRERLLRTFFLDNSRIVPGGFVECSFETSLRSLVALVQVA
jgi:hypothetical protein